MTTIYRPEKLNFRVGLILIESQNAANFMLPTRVGIFPERKNLGTKFFKQINQLQFFKQGVRGHIQPLLKSIDVRSSNLFEEGT